MPDILHEVTIAATPDAVYKVLTEQQGLTSWWTTYTVARPKVGSIAVFSFFGGRAVIKTKIAKLEPGRKVYWTIVEATEPDWSGTDVTWDLTSVENGTTVLFGHRGFASTEGRFAKFSYNWSGYVTSLKDYLETGKGRPMP